MVELDGQRVPEDVATAVKASRGLEVPDPFPVDGVSPVEMQTAPGVAAFPKMATIKVDIPPKIKLGVELEPKKPGRRKKSAPNQPPNPPPEKKRAPPTGRKHEYEIHRVESVSTSTGPMEVLAYVSTFYDMKNALKALRAEAMNKPGKTVTLLHVLRKAHCAMLSVPHIEES